MTSPGSDPNISPNGSDFQGFALPARDAHTAAGTSFDPRAYASVNAALQRRNFETLMEGVTLRRDAVVLDIGSGDGRNTAELLAAAVPEGSVIGLDASEDMVARASEAYPIQTYRNLAFVHGRVQELDSVLKGFDLPIDVVVSNFTLHWIPQSEHQEVFAQLNKFQPIDGEMHLRFSEAGAFSELFEAGYEVIKGPAWSEHFDAGDFRHPPLPEVAIVQEALSCAGYSGDAVFEATPRYFESRAALAGWVGACIRPFMERVKDLDLDTQRRFVGEWIDCYQRRNPELFPVDGRAALMDRTITVHAAKVRNV